MKKILITGASGFFGQALIKELLECQENFECICVYHLQKHDILDKRFEWIQADLLNEKDIQQLIEKTRPTHCVHLAWHVPPQKFWTAQENIDWLYASITLFQEFCKHEGQTFLGAGSLAEYDWSSRVLDEAETPIEPSTLYGQCKKSLHELLLHYRNAHHPDVNIIWPRIGYFFGAGEPQEKLISKLIHHIRNNKPLDLAPEDFSRPYAHIQYWGKTISPLIFKEITKDLTFNMSVTTGYPLKDVVDFIQDHFKDHTTEINYDVYPSTPTSLSVATNPMIEIPDTFFKDLEQFIQEKNA